jgi:hypothetical protein
MKKIQEENEVMKKKVKELETENGKLLKELEDSKQITKDQEIQLSWCLGQQVKNWQITYEELQNIHKEITKEETKCSEEYDLLIDYGKKSGSEASIGAKWVEVLKLKKASNIKLKSIKIDSFDESNDSVDDLKLFLQNFVPCKVDYFIIDGANLSKTQINEIFPILKENRRNVVECLDLINFDLTEFQKDQIANQRGGRRFGRFLKDVKINGESININEE